MKSCTHNINVLALRHFDYKSGNFIRYAMTSAVEYDDHVQRAAYLYKCLLYKYVKVFQYQIV